MTNLDATFDIPKQAPAAVPGRHGIWRVISMLAVVTALIVSALSILQTRDASNVEVLERAAVPLEEVAVTVSGIDFPENAEVAVLGLADDDSRRPFDPTGTNLDVPTNAAALVALTDGDGSIIGLAISAPNQQDRQIEVSLRSTASALLFLSPGILRADTEATFANVAVIEGDEAFEGLVSALAVNSNLSISNPALEQAHAEIADRTPVQRRAPDQGCDSVFANNAYPGAGTCVQPKDTGLLISNEQDRWALIYSGTAGFPDLCATISPTGTDGSEVLIPTEQCEGDSLMVAPGPSISRADDQPIVDERLRNATAVTALYDYVGPFAEVAGGSAGFTAESIIHIRRNANDIVGSLALLAAEDPEFAAAMDIPRAASTALDRHNAAIVAARSIIKASDTTAIIPQRATGDDGHEDLLDYFQRIGDRMISERTDWRWEADAVGMADFGAGS